VSVSAPTVAIRAARPDDLLQVLRLLDGLRHGGERPGPAAALAVWEAMLATPGRSVLVALLDRRVVGTADLLVVPNLTRAGSPWGIVENVVVDPAERGRGIGHVLMRDVIHRAETAGCYKLQLLSRNERFDAHRFYRSLGFEECARGFRLYL
jgi:GNAT superfamily N-acetyltransferase